MSRADRAGPLKPFLDRGRPFVTDGGLATALEASGYRLNTRLWSAELIISAPAAIRAAHRDYLAAGADCLTTASYQATFAGFSEEGFGDAGAAGLMELSVALATEARDEFWAQEANRRGRLRPLVAASIGPYGAYLADGSEYDGRYGVSAQALDDFHRRRFGVLARSAADLVLCETIPSGLEAEVLLRIVAETPEVWVWMSFCCRDGARLCDGTPVEEVARLCEQTGRVVAVGANCVAPAHVGELVERMRAETRLPVIVYPNSGEIYDAHTRKWRWPADGRGDTGDFGLRALEWIARGATGVGGCCRVGPAEIRALRRRVAGETLPPSSRTRLTPRYRAS